MRHIAAERWAAAAAERVSPRELARMTAHVEHCAPCRAARARVLAARVAIAELRDSAAPELAWDAIRAKVRWELSPAGSSTERLLVQRAELLAQVNARAWLPRWARWSGGLAVAAAAAAILYGLARPEAPSRAQVATRPAPVPMAAPAPVAAVPAPSPLAALVTRTRGAVQIDGDADRLFDRIIGPGAVLASGAGGMDVQFGDGSAFALGPRSTLRLERFDSSAIELSIDGRVDLEVAPRLAGQRFLVRAGAQTVEVRGTQFRVEHHADQTQVSCRHGLVTVSEGARSIDVAAGRSVAVQTGQVMQEPTPMPQAEALELALATPYRLPWDDVRSLAASTARLELVVSGKRRLRLDGVELGSGAAEVRVPRGRHLVEASADGGPFRRAGWAVVAAKASAVRFDAGDGDGSAERTDGQRQRLAELLAQLDRARLARCVRPIAKQGLSGTFVGVELSIGRDGTKTSLNILDTDLPAEIAECVRTVIADVHFAVGPAAVVTQRITL